MKHQVVRRAGIAFALCAMGGALPAMAETHTVIVGGPEIGDDVFTPPALTIAVGDTVLWDWDGGLHDVESGVDLVHDGNFDSGAPVSDTATTFEVTFDQAFLDANFMPDNEYPYYCSIHFGIGMIGTITVVNPPIPTVSEWGMAVLVLAVLTAGTIVFGIRRRAARVTA